MFQVSSPLCILPILLWLSWVYGCTCMFPLPSTGENVSHWTWTAACFLQLSKTQLCLLKDSEAEEAQNLRVSEQKEVTILIPASML